METSMTQSDTERARDALREIPQFAEGDPDKVTIARLGGLTNLVFQIQLDQESWCLRLPGEGTEEYIDRRHEAVAARAAAAACVSPQVLYVDEGSGVMLTRYIDGAVTMSPERFANHPGAPARAGRALRKLHISGAKFDARFELFAMVDEYLGILSGKPVDLPDGYHDALAESQDVRAALQAHHLPLAACHCDPLCENFLDTGKRMWIVDWEYSGMNDPMWDLADLSVEGSFGPEQESEMLRAYFDGEPGESEHGRVIIYKAMCDLLWTLWGLIQHANENPVDDFWAYSTGRFERCKALMADPSFSDALAAVRKGPSRGRLQSAP